MHHSAPKFYTLCQWRGSFPSTVHKFLYPSVILVLNFHLQYANSFILLSIYSTQIPLPLCNTSTPATPAGTWTCSLLITSLTLYYWAIPASSLIIWALWSYLENKNSVFLHMKVPSQQVWLQKIQQLWRCHPDSEHSLWSWLWTCQSNIFNEGFALRWCTIKLNLFAKN